MLDALEAKAYKKSDLGKASWDKFIQGQSDWLAKNQIIWTSLGLQVNLLLAVELLTKQEHRHSIDANAQTGPWTHSPPGRHWGGILYLSHISWRVQFVHPLPAMP